MQLTGKTILITGGSRGIGGVTAELAAGRGAKVIINYTTNQAAANQTVDQINQAGGQASAIQTDVTDSTAVKKMIDQVINQFGQLDFLVNNAGVLSTQPIHQEKIETLHHLVDVNLKGVINTIHSALPIMLNQTNGGVIVNVSSQAAREIFPNYHLAAYSATKAGVLRLTQVLGAELADTKVKIYAVLPGGTATDMTDHQGMPAEKVGRRILEVATGQLQLNNGGDSQIYQ